MRNKLANQVQQITCGSQVYVFFYILFYVFFKTWEAISAVVGFLDTELHI